MKKPAMMANSGGPGTLFLVGTPIGNLDDMTMRAIRVLTDADAVFCEDTRRTLQLLRHFKIERPSGIDSFHDHSPPKVIVRIKKLLQDGKSVAYLTDAGMPVVSDPGFVLVRAAHEVRARVTVVPGPSAANMLFAASGLPSPKYFFHGFFPRTRGEVERTLEVVRAMPVAHLFYEAPGRVLQSLEVLQRNLPKAEVVVGRELTKIHEEIVRGSADKVYQELAGREKLRGECVFAVLGGSGMENSKVSKPAPEAGLPFSLEESDSARSIELTDEQKAQVASLIKSGISSKDAARELSKKFGVSRRVIYEFIIRHLT